MKKYIKNMINRIKKKYFLYKHENHLKNLVNNGLVIGKKCNILQQVKIDLSHCWLITIGNEVTIAPRVRILAHDASMKRLIGYTKIDRVNIDDGVFIGAESIILPGVTIGKNSIIGAGSVVTKNVPPSVVCSGNPARVIATLEEFLKKHELNISRCICFDEAYTIAGGVTEKKRKK